MRKSKKQKPSLVIVESPTKEKTISRFLKEGFFVKSSFGHVRDLPPKDMGVDEKNGFEPTYVLLPRTKQILPALKKLLSQVEFVYLATDHDREGESIAWHLIDILHIPPSQAKRITFHEITPEAIEEALKSPREIDYNLVQAQQARRVLDRLVGYKLSPLLWEKVKQGLSAGRVQSVSVRLLVERDQEIAQFQPQNYWTISANLEKRPEAPAPDQRSGTNEAPEGRDEARRSAFEASLDRWQGQKLEQTHVLPLFADEYRFRTTFLKSEVQAQEWIRQLQGRKFLVMEKKCQEVHRRPAPPFITSTLQQDASRKLGFTSDRTMRIAQTLYEGVEIGGDERVGLITYMRTDSYSVAASAQKAARQFVEQFYGPSYLPEAPPVYHARHSFSQEAHEAIRPTQMAKKPEEIKSYLSAEQYKLYRLIWRRFLASQMADAVYETVALDVGAAIQRTSLGLAAQSDSVLEPRAGEAVFHATGRTLKFAGFMKVYHEEEEESSLEEKQKILPPLDVGEELNLLELKFQEHRTGPPPRYSEASLIRDLEKHGIGRPSTYAPILKTILNRVYARMDLKERRLYPTELGTLVTEKLKAHFPEVTDLSFTARVESRLDNIAEGKESWQKVVEDFYLPLEQDLKKARETMTESKYLPKESEEKCPTCGSTMHIRESRFGKYLCCSRFPKCRGKIQLDAQENKVLPEPTQETCDLCGQPMVIRTGRKGRFLACSAYPACKNTFSIGPDGKKIPGSQPKLTQEKCSKCGSPLWLRQGKRGPFLACSAFPKCRNLLPISKEKASGLIIPSAH